MSRISLVQQYDNKDVIQQIYDLKDRQTTLEETQEGFQSSVDNAVQQAQTATQTAQNAENTAQNALETAQGFADDIAQVQSDISQAEQDIQTVEGNLDELETTVDGTVASGAVVTTATTAILRLTKVNNSTTDSDIPLASGTVTGMMTAQTYNGIVQLQDRVTALEASQNVYYVTFASDDPSQLEITTAFQTAASRAPQAGDYATDIGRGLTYGYDGTQWIKVESGQIPAFTNASAGLIKGNGTDAGTVFAEADGTGSVNGWDTLVQNVQNNTTSIGSPSDPASATGSLYARIADNATDITNNTADIATKQNIITAVTVTLLSTAWNDNQQTQAAANVTANNIIWVSPSVTSFDAYGEAGIRAIAQGAGTITFQCTDVPTEDISVEVVA